MWHRFFIVSFFSVMTFSISGCESAEDQAERIRLEKLYAMDSREIASALSRSYAEPYKEVRKECQKERIEKNPGKWCGKWKEVEAAYKPKFDFSRPDF